ncbi:DUF4185 domain-containing protein [Mycolicibacterium confluentis]|uniref:DUF4185 domain-containing protein n=1 Tax=Mycolicibacterium confluentis TaxID=28047 RepID=A0A7I7XUY0_9MYCO|nr:DUF4185 domain-containing protein [Mycolicibacterium confluentis]BBZ33058.1 hypothetical protein MCNF_16630 [Mycolicibacterium confluentis]
MDSSRYVGRVGALAVAFGIGAAVTTGTGVAWADGPETGGDKSSQAGTSPGGSGDSTTTRSTPADRLTRIADRVRRSVEDTGDRIRKGIEDGAAKAQKNLEDSAKTTKVKLPQRQPRDLDASATVPGVTAPEAPAPTGATAPTGSTRKPARATPDGTAAPSPLRRTPTTTRTVSLSDAVTSPAPRLTAAPAATIAALTQIPDRVAARTVEVSTATSLETPVTDTAPKLTNLVSGFLAAAGLAPLAGGSPTAPAQTPGLWALVAWARREYERTLTPQGKVVSVADAQPVAAAVVDPNAGLTPKPATPILTPGDTIGMEWVTGGNLTDVEPASPNAPTPNGYGIAGTDLGIMWDDGNGNVMMLFGDTFDQPGMKGVWRNNVLLRSTDYVLSDGKLTIKDGLYSDGGVYGPTTNNWSNLWGATQAIRNPGFNGLFGSTTTIIPTSAIEVDGVQYATVMSVRTWDNPGSWTTNWSAIAVSHDDGKTWTVDPDTVRSSGWLRSSTPYVPGNNHFQQNALVTSPDESDPYVYVYGTPSGRQGSAYLARVPKDEITNLKKYEYWAGEVDGQGSWVANDPSAAVPVIGKVSSSRPGGFIGWITKAINNFLGGIIVGGYEGGNVSEMSVQYNEYLGKYVVLYTDGGNNVVMRVSDSPQGTWSDAAVLVANNPTKKNAGTGQANTGMYGPMIHPWSGTGKLKNTDGTADDSNLYYNLSYWGPYNVSLMQTDLSGVKAQYATTDTITV